MCGLGLRECAFCLRECADGAGASIPDRWHHENSRRPAGESGPEGGDAMDENGLARALGRVSVGVGLAALAAPGPLMKAIGLGDRPTLGRLVGARDLVLGAGLLRGHDTAGWCRARGIADALDVALIIGGAAAGAFRRDRAPIGVATGAGFSALSFWLAHRLEQ